MVRVFPNLVDTYVQKELSEEIVNSNMFREYPIQGSSEPRLHFLLHDQATENFKRDRKFLHHVSFVFALSAVPSIFSHFPV